LENRLPVRPTAQRSISDNPAVHTVQVTEVSRPGFARSQTAAVVQCSPEVTQSSLQAQPLHKRLRSLRPSPLDLTQDVSPSDRAIMIGLDIPSTSLKHLTSRDPSPRTQHPLRRVEEVQTPTIVITPAQEDFGLSASPDANGYRPRSSVYSRYTNGAVGRPQYGNTPPVPPLPLFVNRQAPRASAVTVFEEDAEDHVQPGQARRLTSQSLLPTPRRSKGWWNVLTSPFSAGSGSKSNAFFWRSPPLPEDGQDRIRILDDASDMATVDAHGGVIFLNRTEDDDELRTALPPDTGSERPPMPKRSDTAPGALDANVGQINIYRIPSQGLAAAYYDPNRRLSSMILGGSESSGDARDLEDWSPSQSVAHPEDDRYLSFADDSQEMAASINDSAGNEPENIERGVENDGDARDAESDEGAHEADEGPFADTHETDEAVPPPAVEHNTFSTPSEDELKEATPPRPTLNDRSNTQATQASVMSAFSPLTATPIVEEAHTARLVGPSSEMGDVREVELTPARGTPLSGPPPPLPPPPAGLCLATMAHRETEPTRVDAPMSEKAPFRPQVHVRDDSSSSIGLGISGDGSEKELFPPPRSLREQPRLGTDRFGQLTVERGGDRAPSRPWFRRFFWLLTSSIVLLLLTAIVLLVVFVPGQTHTDTAVQAEWLNLTGFPALPTGVATVVQPSNVKSVSGCVNEQALWSCGAPVAQPQNAGEPAQPNFRFEIRFRNGTVLKNETQLARRSAGSAMTAGALVRRNSFTSSLYTANPPAPSKHDQLFLGQYTDNVTAPHNGEETPFYMSLLNPSVLQTKSKLDKRHEGYPYPYPTTSGTNSSTSSTNASRNAASNIPRPALKGNGEPAEAELYPYAEAQPLRLFDRGQDTEHYGFYTYFDRTLYVSNVSSTSSADNMSNVALDGASAVCTWSQTRLHVQIWTQKSTILALPDQTVPLSGLPALNSTANDMTGSGSVPYAVTITLDRHGGAAKKKGVYCYGLDEEHKIMENVKMWVNENRAFAGELINRAAVPSSNGTTLTRRHEDAYGGIDGGTGGCACSWQNWK